jgi:DNA-binding CsgD family transcriptional regulator
MSSALRVIEAAYVRRASDEAWLSEVAEVIARELGPHGGGVAYFVRWRPHGLPETRGWTRVGSATEDDLACCRGQHEGPMPEELVKDASRVYARGSILTGSREAMDEILKKIEAIHGGLTERTGSYDSLNLLCTDATHEGVSFLHPSREEVRTHPQTRALWSRVAAHVTAGLRMQRAASGSSLLDGADAILDPAGHVLDAAKGAEASLSVLRDAARDVDRARLRGTDEHEALDLWQCLFSGEYSVVDRFDTDGKRLFVAKKNAPTARGPRALTERERQVVALVAVGHADKSVAYELGIAEGTVARYLHVALRKLGIADTSDLGLLRAAMGDEG